MFANPVPTIANQWSVVYERFVLKQLDAPYRVIHYEVPRSMQEHLSSFVNARPELIAVAVLTTLIMCAVMLTMHLVFSTFSKRYAQKFTFAERVECVERVASTLHASLVFLIAFTTLLLDSELPHDPILGTPSPYYFGLQFAISCGYFTSDALVLLFSRIPQWEPVVIHHVLAIWGCLGIMGYYIQFSYIGVILFLTEMTNPFNNADWYFQMFGNEWSVAGRATKLSLTVSWIVSRLLPFLYIFYLMYLHWSDVVGAAPLFQIIIASNIVFLFAMNYYWFFVGGPFYHYIAVILFGTKPRPTSSSPNAASNEISTKKKKTN